MSSSNSYGGTVMSTAGLASFAVAFTACAGLDADHGIIDDPAATATQLDELGGDDAVTDDAFPDDTYYDLQWNLPMIGVPVAWSILRPPGSNVLPGSPAVRIAIIDSGALAHPDLVGRFTGGMSLADAGGPGDVGSYHHGTHVAGIIGASTHTASPRGVAGICPGCTMIPLRMTTATSSELVLERFKTALHWAAGDSNGGVRQADVINLSMNRSENTACPADVADAVQYANAHGVVVVVSAGNYGTTGVHRPANCPGVISVAAIERNKALAVYTDRGNVTLAAPGGTGFLPGDGAGGGYGPVLEGCTGDQLPNTYDGVLSTWATYPSVNPSGSNYCYRYLSGTSMAAPHVTATVGLMLSARPANVTFTPAQITRILQLTAEILPCSNATGGCGAGLLDTGAAVTAASHGGAPVLTATPAAISFGLHDVGTASANATVTVGNDGVGPLTVGGPSGFEITGANPTQFELGLAGCPAQTCSLAFTIPEGASPIGVPVRCHPTTLGTLSANLVIHSDSIRGTMTIPMSCTGTQPPLPVLALSATSLQFALGHLHTPAPSQPLTIANPGTAPLTFSTTIAAPFSATCTAGCTCAGTSCSGTLPPSGAATLAIGYTPTLVGAQTGALSIASNDPSHLSATVALQGAGGIGTGALPAFGFGNVQVGVAATGTVTLTNTGSFPLAVTAIDLGDATNFDLAYPSGPCAGAIHCATAQTVAISGTLAIPVRCHPATIGSHATALQVTGNGSPVVASAQLSCIGIVPHVQVTPASLAFGTVAIGATSSALLTITNVTAGTNLGFTASSGLSLYALSCVHGCTCADDICTGVAATLPAQVRVSFTPTTVNDHPSTITFVTNDPTTPITSVAVTGTGYGPVFKRMEPASGELDFVAPIGVPSDPGLVRIFNSGNAPLHINSASFSGNVAAAMAFTAATPLPATVAPGATFDVSVTCTPSAAWRAGVHTGQMTFTADPGLDTTIIELGCSALIR